MEIMTSVTDSLANNTPQWRTKEAEIICNFANDVIDKEDSMSLRVGLAGSAPLSWFLDNAETQNERTPCGFRWKDADFFVCGHHAETAESFSAFIEEIIFRMEETGYQITEVQYSSGGNYDDCMGPPGMELQVVEFTIKEISTPLSFIQCPGFDNVLEVIENFDLSVCKVAYNTYTKRHQISEDVCDQILSGVMDLAFPIIDLINTRYLSETEMYKLEAHRRRISKYRRRGFAVGNCIWCDSDIQAALDRSFRKHEYNLDLSKRG